MKHYLTALFPGLTLTLAMSVLIGGCDGRVGPTGVPVASTTVGNEIDDSVVTTRVKSALLTNLDVRSSDIKVETRKGIVQISGFIDSQARIDQVVALVLQIEGVKGVQDGMTLKDGKASMGNAVDDSVITAQVKSALFSDPGVKSFDVAVVTRKGEVQLSGFVDAPLQISRVLEITRSIPGVTSVDNKMTVKK